MTLHDTTPTEPTPPAAAALDSGNRQESAAAPAWLFYEAATKYNAPAWRLGIYHPLVPADGRAVVDAWRRRTKNHVIAGAAACALAAIFFFTMAWGFPHSRLAPVLVVVGALAVGAVGVVSAYGWRASAPARRVREEFSQECPGAEFERSLTLPARARAEAIPRIRRIIERFAEVEAGRAQRAHMLLWRAVERGLPDQELAWVEGVLDPPAAASQ